MRKLFRKIHLWLSIPFGLIITLICFSGAMLVFEDEVNELLHPDLYYVKKVEVTPLPINELLKKVADVLPDSVSIAGISVFADSERTYQVSLSKPRRSSLYIDQYTGEITGKKQRNGFFTFMFRMHRWLLDSVSPNGGIFVGKLVVGISTLLFVVVLISGVIAWCPCTRKALKCSMKISMNKGWRRCCHGLHVAGGMYGVVLLLGMALTGLTWSFPWYRTAFYKVFGVELQQQTGHVNQQSARSQEGKHERRGDGQSGKLNIKGNHELSKHHESQKKEPPPFAYWQEIYNELSARNPEYKQISVSSGIASVSFNRFGNQRAADRYTFHVGNGEITETSLYQHQDKAGKIRGWIYSVHVGNWGGMPARILTFLAALLGATLPLTGYYLWVKKLINKNKRIRSMNVSKSPLR